VKGSHNLEISLTPIIGETFREGCVEWMIEVSSESTKATSNGSGTDVVTKTTLSMMLSFIRSPL
jgi:hypothetical protein